MSPHLGPFAMLPDQVEFMIWGDLLILERAMALDEGEYMKERGISAGSMHKLLLHSLGAQWVWLHRLLEKPMAPPSLEALPTRDALQKRWPEVHAALREFIGRQTLETLSRTIAFKNFRDEPYEGRIGDLLMHVTDHGTYHRGQQNTLLKLAGGTPVDIFFYQWRVKNPA